MNQELDSTRALRLAISYYESEMPDADAATIEQAARAFLAALMDE